MIYIKPLTYLASLEVYYHAAKSLNTLSTVRTTTVCATDTKAVFKNIWKEKIIVAFVKLVSIICLKIKQY